jgi:hypothetical protein
MTAKRKAIVEDDDSMGPVWKAYREAQQARRARRLPERTEEILRLRADNFRVRRLTNYQYRVDERLDLFPIHRRYHDIKVNKRGTYQTAKQIAVRVLRSEAKESARCRSPSAAARI